MKTLISCIFILLISLSCTKNTGSASATPLPEVRFTVQKAPDWTLFKRSQSGFGGNGIFAIPFSGKTREQSSENDSILFAFSDTMVGAIEEGRLPPAYKAKAHLAISKPGEVLLSYSVNSFKCF